MPEQGRLVDLSYIKSAFVIIATNIWVLNLHLWTVQNQPTSIKLDNPTVQYYFHGMDVDKWGV